MFERASAFDSAGRQDLRAVRDALAATDLPERPWWSLRRRCCPRPSASGSLHPHHVGGDGAVLGRLLDWANAALRQRIDDEVDYATAACVTFMPRERRVRWATRAIRRPCRSTIHASSGMLLYTDGLTEARRGMRFFGLERVMAALGDLHHPSPMQAVETLWARVGEFATTPPTDDLCLLAARFN